MYIVYCIYAFLLKMQKDKNKKKKEQKAAKPRELLQKERIAF